MEKYVRKMLCIGSTCLVMLGVVRCAEPSITSVPKKGDSSTQDQTRRGCVDVEVEEIRLCAIEKMCDFVSPAGCPMASGVMTRGTLFNDAVCYEAFVAQCCDTDISSHDLDFNSTMIVLVDGTTGTGRADLVLESTQSCNDNLRIRYHVLSCGDSDTVCSFLWTVRLPLSEYQAIDFENAGVQDGIPREPDGCEPIM